MVDGDYVFVSGTTGFDYRTMTISEDPGEQAEQCFRNVEQLMKLEVEVTARLRA